MRNLTIKLLTAAFFAALPVAMSACGDDEDKPVDPAPGGTTGTGGGGPGAGGTGQTGGSDGAGGSASGGAPGSGGEGGGMPETCDLSGTGKERESLPAQITADRTLDSNKVYVLEGLTYVNDGVTLTIPKCTRIEGKKGPPPGTLIVMRGGKLMAVGTRDEPILFTSDKAVGSRAAGDWGGVILLGKAVNYQGANVRIEGLADLPENQYGGTDDADSSGHLSYVRIDYSGFELDVDIEINGLTMGSVGSGTVIDHIMVSNTLDDGFEWFGGTVSTKYLVVNNAGDDMFDADFGYRGSLQFLFGRQVVPLTKDPNGFEMDSDNGGTKTPPTNLKVSNATLCGAFETGDFRTYGMVLRERLQAQLMNVIATGFDVGVDARNSFGTVETPNVTLTHTLFFDQVVHNISDPADDDSDTSAVGDFGFNETAWFNKDGSSNGVTKPEGFGDCQANPPAVYPTAAVTGGAPPAGMDTAANYVGAFKDATDNWMTGAWIDWAEQ